MSSKEQRPVLSDNHTIIVDWQNKMMGDYERRRRSAGLSRKAVASGVLNF